MAQEEIDIKIKAIVDTANSEGSVRGISKAIKELTALSIKAGEENQEAFIKAASAAGELQDKVNRFNETVRQSTGKPFEDMAGGLNQVNYSLSNLDFGGVTDGLASITKSVKGTDLKTFTSGLKSMATEFISLGKALIFNPIFLLAGAIILIITQFDKLKAAGGVIGDMFTALGDSITNTTDKIERFLNSIGAIDTYSTKKADIIIANSKKETEAITERYDVEIALAKASGEDTSAIEAEKTQILIKNTTLRINELYRLQSAGGKLNEAQLKELEDLKKARQTDLNTLRINNRVLLTEANKTFESMSKSIDNLRIQEMERNGDYIGASELKFELMLLELELEKDINTEEKINQGSNLLYEKSLLGLQNTRINKLKEEKTQLENQRELLVKQRSEQDVTNEYGVKNAERINNKIISLDNKLYENRVRLEDLDTYQNELRIADLEKVVNVSIKKEELYAKKKELILRASAAEQSKISQELEDKELDKKRVAAEKELKIIQDLGKSKEVYTNKEVKNLNEAQSKLQYLLPSFSGDKEEIRAIFEEINSGIRQASSLLENEANPLDAFVITPEMSDMSEKDYADLFGIYNKYVNDKRELVRSNIESETEAAAKGDEELKREQEKSQEELLTLDKTYGEAKVTLIKSINDRLLLETQQRLTTELIDLDNQAAIIESKQRQNSNSLYGSTLGQDIKSRNDKLANLIKTLETERDLEISNAEKIGADVEKIRAKYDEEIKEATIENSKLTFEAVIAEINKVTGAMQASMGYITQISNSLAEFRDRNLTQADKDSIQYKKKEFNRTKALGIADASISTAAGVARAFADYSLPYSVVIAALAAAAGGAQIAAISSQQFDASGNSDGQSSTRDTPIGYTTPAFKGVQAYDIGTATPLAPIGADTGRVSVLESDITRVVNNVDRLQRRVTIK